MEHLEANGGIGSANGATPGSSVAGGGGGGALVMVKMVLVQHQKVEMVDWEFKNC